MVRLGAMSDVTVTRNDSESRYEARIDGQLAGFTEFVPGEGMLVFPHTVVLPEYEGQGVGSTLARGALDDVRARGQKVLATCPFIHGWMVRHPDYMDLFYKREHAEDPERVEQD